jgi:hypothetical protein
VPPSPAPPAPSRPPLPAAVQPPAPRPRCLSRANHPFRPVLANSTASSLRSRNSTITRASATI